MRQNQLGDKGLSPCVLQKDVLGTLLLSSASALVSTVNELFVHGALGQARLPYMLVYPLAPALIVVVQSLSRVWLFATPWTVNRQAPLSMGFPRQEYWRGWLLPPPGDLPNPGMEPASLMSPASAGGFSCSATWEAPLVS